MEGAMAGIGQIGGMLPLLSNMIPVNPARAAPDPDVIRNARAAMERMKAEPDAAQTARFFATKAHSVLRRNGEIAAIQWSDGTTEVRKPTGQPWDKERLIQQGMSSGLSQGQMNDLYVRDLAKTLGAGISIDRYDGRADAPSRRDLMDSPVSGPARGRRLSLVA
ncbi:hypothetical protein AZL_002980 [Azospirillum sp. B510]|nr:hypothetical protein AZL_002980 [Azospirillum sp. B510]